MFKSFKSIGLALAACIIPPVLAQHNMSVLQIEAVKAHFSQAGLVPSVLQTFSPIATLSVSFKGLGNVVIGQPVTREQALWEPTLVVTPANASTTLRDKFTVMMVDAGAPGSNQLHGQLRHWLVNNVSIPATVNTNLSMTGASVITQYIPPNPAVGDGPHRVVILVFNQPAEFFSPPDLSRDNSGGGSFSVEAYARYTKLGPIVAATYFTCQQGPATGSIPPTSAVVSSTLAGWNVPSAPAQTTKAVAQKANSGLSATRNALALFLAPIMGLLAL